jgi:hypothetical protein
MKKKKKKHTNLENTFFFFLSLDLSYFQTSQLSYFLFILNDLKFSRIVTSSFTIHLGTLIATEQHTRNLLGVQEPAFLASSDLFFLVLDPLYFGGYNFLNSISFFTLF